MIKKNIKFFLFILLTIFLLTTSISIVKATEISYPTLGGINPSSNPSLPSFVKYLFLFGVFLGFFAAFISLAIAAAMWSLSPVNASLLAKSKDRVYGSIAAIILLALLYLIVTTLSPSLGVFSSTKLSAIPPNPSSTPQPPSGVYFYSSTDCSAKNNTTQIQYDTSTVSDLGSLKNNVNSVATVQDPNTMYVSVLYDTVNLQGKCQVVDPTNKLQSCKSESSTFTDSAAIFQYNPQPKGDGVYFYRKDCFNTPQYTCAKGSAQYVNDPLCECTNASCLSSECNLNGGGYYEISNDDILKSIKNGSAGYLVSLDSLKFTKNSSSKDCTVQKYEQDCTQYDANGKCTNWSCPTLGGQNISSVVINGPYVVLFIYKAEGDASLGPWTYCQQFPTNNDINGIGPLKTSWQNIRNRVGQVPNYVEVIPIIKQ